MIKLCKSLDSAFLDGFEMTVVSSDRPVDNKLSFVRHPSAFIRQENRGFSEVLGGFTPASGETFVTDEFGNVGIAALGTGRFVTVWSDLFDGLIIGQIFNSDGTPFGGEITVSTNSEKQGFPFVTELEGGAFLVTWTREIFDAPNEIYARLYDSSGAAVGGEFLVAEAAGFTGTQGGVESVDAFSDGGFLITWSNLPADETQRIFISQVYAADGTPTGVPFETGGIAAALAGGGIAAIGRTPFDADRTGPIVRLFNQAGEQVVNDIFLDGFQGRLDIAPLDDGGFVVVGGEFTSEGEAGLSKVVAQIFDANGLARGPEIRVSEMTLEFVSPSVESLAGGGFLVSWTAFDAALETDVYGRVFDRHGLPLGPETLINETATGDQRIAFEGEAATQLSDGQLVFLWEGEGVGAPSGATFFRRFMLEADNCGISTLGNGTANLLAGTACSDTLLGKGGDDILAGRSGADILDGAAGSDWADYRDASAKVVAHLGKPSANSGDAAGDQYVSIENLRGSERNDRLLGDDLANRIEGLGKNDNISGRDGDDVLAGGLGRDTLKGGLGDDQFELASLEADDAEKIIDFDRAADLIALDRHVYQMTEVKPGHLVIGNAAGDANDRLIYDDTTGKLFFDADGTGAEAKVLIATFTGAPALSAGDFVVI